jgi:glutaredoxin 3
MKTATIYTTRSCPYCVKAKKILTAKGISFQEIDVTGDDAAREKLVIDSGGAMTVPQIWIGTTHVGGCGDLQELVEEGRLEALLA